MLVKKNSCIIVQQTSDPSIHLSINHPFLPKSFRGVISLHGYTLGQVTGLVHVQLLEYGDMIG